jgi:hypothetical protein
VLVELPVNLEAPVNGRAPAMAGAAH